MADRPLNLDNMATEPDFSNISGFIRVPKAGEDEYDRAVSINTVVNNTLPLLEGLPAFIAALTPEQVELAATAVSFDGEFIQKSGNEIQQKSLIPNLENAHNPDYMLASTSKPMILKALVEIAREMGIDLENTTFSAEDPQVGTILARVALEASSSDRVSFEEARKEVSRQATEAGIDLTEDQLLQEVEQHLTQHTGSEISFKALVWLALHYSGNSPLMFLRKYLLSRGAAADESELFNKIQEKISKSMPSYGVYTGATWTDPKPNVGNLYDAVTAFEEIIRTGLAKEASEPQDQSSEVLMIQAIRNNPRAIEIWHEGFNEQIKAAITQKTGKKVKNLYIKTGDYPAVRYPLVLVNAGDPCHQIVTVLVTAELEDGTLVTYGMFKKYISLMQVDTDVAESSLGKSGNEIESLEEDYLKKLLVNSGNEFLSSLIELVVN